MTVTVATAAAEPPPPLNSARTLPLPAFEAVNRPDEATVPIPPVEDQTTAAFATSNPEESRPTALKVAASPILRVMDAGEMDAVATFGS